MANERLDVSNTNKLLQSVVNQFIVRPIGSPNLTGLSGFVFDILDEEEVHIDSEITDHFVEDNFTIQDHIALRPERFVLKGYVAELTDIFPNSLLSILTQIQSLGSIGGFLPEFTSQATQVYAKIASVASKVGQVINQVANVFDIFSQYSTTTNKQQKAYNYFYSMWFSRMLFTIETPFAIFPDMAIESLRVVQGGQTRYISDFAITFKRIRKASTVLIPGTLTSNNPDGAGAISGKQPVLDKKILKDVVSHGQTSGTQRSISTILKEFTAGGF